jgi:hypothetical protein
MIYTVDNGLGLALAVGLELRQLRLNKLLTDCISRVTFVGKPLHLEIMSIALGCVVGCWLVEG